MVYFAKWKVVLVIAACALGFAFSIPNFLDQKIIDKLPDWLPHKQVSLGLDLQGGSHLLLEVGFDAVVKEQIESLVDTMRVELRKGRFRYTGLGVEGQKAKVTIRRIEDVEDALAALKGIDPGVEPEVTGNTIRLSFTEESLNERRTAALSQSLEIIRRRVDETGVREPTIQRQGDNRILLQVPGVDDPERLKKLIGKTAKMTFHLVHAQSGAQNLNLTPPGAKWLPH